MIRVMKSKMYTKPSHKHQKRSFLRCEIEIAEGLEAIAKAELIQFVGRRDVARIEVVSGAVQFDYSGDLRELLRLKTVNAIYIVQSYTIPRPKALLGHENFQTLIQTSEQALQTGGKRQFESLHLSAAGSDTSVMTRIKNDLADALGLAVGEDTGDLLVRVRRNNETWEVLVRISARPSATRNWRVCNMEGALNAPVASAMITLTKPQKDDVFVNLMCGSATLMIERSHYDSTSQIIGIDNDIDALNCATENINAARRRHEIRLVHADVNQVPLQNNIASVICADLPFGQLVGSHEENIQLYPAVLNEAARIGKHDACFVLLTHEVRLMETLLHENPHWETERVIKVSLRGLYPRIFLLQKRQ